MSNKMFVIGRKYNATCEVFDSSSMKFTSIKQLDRNCYFSVSAVSIGDKISIYCTGLRAGKERVYTYNVDKNEWYCISNSFLDFEDGVVSISKLSVI